MIAGLRVGFVRAGLLFRESRDDLIGEKLDELLLARMVGARTEVGGTASILHKIVRVVGFHREMQIADHCFSAGSRSM